MCSSVTFCLENSCQGDVEEEEYSWTDVNGPIVADVELQLVGRGAVPRFDDVLQTEESGWRERKSKRRKEKCEMNEGVLCVL